MPHSKNRKSDKTYTFNKILTEEASQEETYSSTVKELLDDVLAGYNATVFAYGATGAGKTYTYFFLIIKNFFT